MESVRKRLLLVKATLATDGDVAARRPLGRAVVREARRSWAVEVKEESLHASSFFKIALADTSSGWVYREVCEGELRHQYLQHGNPSIELH
jgi:hypothetical protein